MGVMLLACCREKLFPQSSIFVSTLTSFSTSIHVRRHCLNKTVMSKLSLHETRIAETFHSFSEVCFSICYLFYLPIRILTTNAHHLLLPCIIKQLRHVSQPTSSLIIFLCYCTNTTSKFYCFLSIRCLCFFHSHSVIFSSHSLLAADLTSYFG